MHYDPIFKWQLQILLGIIQNNINRCKKLIVQLKKTFAEADTILSLMYPHKDLHQFFFPNGFDVNKV